MKKNIAKCAKCGDVIRSIRRHDWIQCTKLARQKKVIEDMRDGIQEIIEYIAEQKETGQWVDLSGRGFRSMILGRLRDILCPKADTPESARDVWDKLAEKVALAERVRELIDRSINQETLKEITQ